EDRGEILAIEPAGNLLQISLADMKVSRKIAVGNVPAGLCFAPGSSKYVWVSNAGSKNLVKIDVGKGQATDTIICSVAPGSVLAFRRYLLYEDPTWKGIFGVDTADKKDLGKLDLTFEGMAYESRNDRIWGLGSICLDEFDGSKVGAAMNQMS